MVLAIRFGENGDVVKCAEPNAEVRFSKMLLGFLMTLKFNRPVNFSITHFALKYLTRLRLLFLYLLPSTVVHCSLDSGR